MRTFRKWIHRFWGTLHPRRSDNELEQELRLHLELAAEDARRRGLARETAVRAATLQAGAASQAVEAFRDQRVYRGCTTLTATCVMDSAVSGEVRSSRQSRW